MAIAQLTQQKTKFTTDACEVTMQLLEKYGLADVVSLTSKGSLKLQIDGLSNRSNISKDWIFYSFPKPLQILSNPEDETTIRVLKADKSISIANDQVAIIDSLHKSCFLYARI
jgi:hypothetical protein